MSTPVPPAVPQIAGSEVIAHQRVHAELHRRVASAGPVTRSAFVALMRRITVEGLANLRPVLADPGRPLLLPAPRRFLTSEQQTRAIAAGAAFGHLDSRMAMVRAGHVDHILGPSTPEVLNALLQGGVAVGRETNPGLVRATPTNWKPEVNAFEHPPAQACRALLDDSVQIVRTVRASPIVLAGWFAFTVMSVHPFVDGNGRTARAGALGIASAGVPLGIDWGLLEQWSLDRDSYVDALQAGQRAERYAGPDVDAGPFVAFTVATSRRGAEVALERLTALEICATSLADRGLEEWPASLVLRVAIDRFTSLDHRALDHRALDHRGPDHRARSAGTPNDPPIGRTATAVVEQAVSSGWVQWASPPAGATVTDGRSIGLAPGPAATDLVDVSARLRAGDELTQTVR